MFAGRSAPILPHAVALSLYQQERAKRHAAVIPTIAEVKAQIDATRKPHREVMAADKSARCVRSGVKEMWAAKRAALIAQFPADLVQAIRKSAGARYGNGPKGLATRYGVPMEAVKAMLYGRKKAATPRPG